MTDLQDWIGRTEEASDIITPASVNRFCATLDIARSDATDVPLGLHWCLCTPETPTAELAADGHPRKGGFLPPVDAPRRMWAGGQLKFHAPMQVGDSVRRLSTIAAITEKTGRTGPLVFVEIDHQIFAREKLCIEERQTLVYRETATQSLTMPPETAPDFGNWTEVQEINPDSKMLFRYSALTFNSHRIHYDLPYTQDQEGYPGLIVHGPLMATLLLQFAEEKMVGRPIKSFSFQSITPAFCNKKLYLVYKETERDLTLAALGGDGRTVMEASAF